MPIEYTIDLSRRLIRATIVGNFTTEEALACVGGAVAEVGEKGFNILSDHREIGTPATREQLEAMIGKLSALRSTVAGANWAVVVGKPSSYGMMRMLRVLAQRVPIRVEIFESMEEAESWLDAICTIVERDIVAGAAKPGLADGEMKWRPFA